MRDLARRPSRTAAAVVAALVLVPAGASAAAAETLTGPAAAEAAVDATSGTTPTVVSDGDVSVGFRLRDGVLESGYVQDAGASWHEVADTIIQVTPAAQTTLGEAWSRLGAVGSTMWLTPGNATQPHEGVVRVARDAGGVDKALLSTSEAAVTGGRVAGVDLSLTGVAGPGRFAAFASSYRSSDGLVTLGSTSPVMDSASELPQVLSAATASPAKGFGATEAAFGWAFDAAGIYCLDMTAAVRLASGQVASSRHAYTVVIGDLPDTVTTCTQPDNDPGDPAPTVVSDGDVSVGFRLRDGVLESGYVQDAGASWREVADTIIQVTPAAQTTLSEAWSALGAVGSTMWLTPGNTTQPHEGVVRVGRDAGGVDKAELSTSEAAVAGGRKSGVDLVLTGVEGPGRFAAFGSSYRNGQETPASTTPILDSAGELPQVLSAATASPPKGLGAAELPFGWAFDAAGTYCLDMTAAVRLASGEVVSSRHAYTVVVGDLPDTLTTCPQPDDDDPGADPGDPGTDPGDPGTDPGEEPGSDVEYLTDGIHVDAFAPQLLADDGAPELRMQAKVGLGSRAYFVDWDDVVLYAPGDGARTTIPADSDAARYGFLGEPGQTVWQMSGNQGPFPWAGTSTESGTLTGFTAGTTLRVDAITGSAGQEAPGEVVLWHQAAASTASISGFGTMFSTYVGLPSAHYLPFNTHDHYNWTFSAPGVYCIATTVVGDETTTGTRYEARGQLTVALGVDKADVEPCERTQDYPTATPEAQRPDPVTVPAGTTTVLTSGAVRPVPHLDGEQIAVSFEQMPTDSARGGRTQLIDPDDAVFVVDDTRVLPITDANSYLGPVGGRYYQWAAGGGWQSHPVLVGWDASAVDSTTLQGDLAWTVADVDGPGTVAIRGTQAGQETSYRSADGTGFGAIAVRPGYTGGARFVYEFSAPGVYCVAMALDGVLAGGAPTHGQALLTVVVNYGDTYTAPSSVTPCGHGGGGDGPGTDPDPDPGAEPGNGSWADLPDSGREVLSVGHMDVLSTVGAGSLRVQVHDDNYSPAKIHEIDDVTFFAAPESSVTDPGLSSVLGAGRTQAWVLPQVQDLSLLWPGWNVAPSGTRVTWTLDGVQGPGRFALFETTGFDDVSVLLSSFGAQKSFSYDEHAHGSWAFTEQGVYCLDSTFSSGAEAGKVSRSVTLLLGVGDVDPAKVTPAMCGKTPEQIVDDALPTVAPRPVAESALTGGVRGPVRVANAGVSVSGGTVDVFVEAGQASRAVSLWWYSTPTHLGWVRVGADGWVRGVKIPATNYGQHKLVVLDRDGRLVGWAPVQVDLLAGGGPGGGGGGASGQAGATPPPAAAEACVATPVTRTVSASNVEVVSSGHFDFGSQLVGGQLVSRVKDDRNGVVWKDPGSLVFHVSDAAKQTVPAGYEFLGAAGTSVWSIPLSQKPAIPWLGWNTQHSSLLSGLAGPVTFTLTSADGPGQVAVYTYATFGGVGERVWDTVGGPRSSVVALNQHVHANWSFTAPGVYHLTFTQSATTTSGQKVSSTGTLSFFVGSGDPRAAAPTTTVTEWVGRTASGAECDLSGDQLTAARGTTTPTVLTARAAAQVGVPVAVLDAAAGDDRPDQYEDGVAVAGRGGPGQSADPAGRDPAVLALSVLAGVFLAGGAATGTFWRRRSGKVAR